MTEFDQSKAWELKHLDGRNAEKFGNVRFNETERKLLRELKNITNCDRNSTVLKKCLLFTYGFVTQGKEMKEFFEWLAAGRRVRPGPKRF